MEWAQKADYAEGFAWIADYQSAGKGQRGNTWTSNAGENLLFSILLKPHQNLINSQFYLSKAIAIGVLEGLTTYIKHQKLEVPKLEIKWPNDLYLNGKKMGGILLESHFVAGKWNFCIAGIGLNINQKSFEDLRANSLSKALNIEEIDRVEVFNFLCQGLEKNYTLFLNQHWDLLDQAYHNHLFRMNQWAKYQRNQDGLAFEGKISAVDSEGYLVMDTRLNRERYDLKEIIFIFP